MAELKTKQTSASVADFIASVPESQQADSQAVIEMMSKATRSEPKMWGSSIVGFGYEKLKYESGRELDWFQIGFSPRKGTLTLYVLRGGEEKYADLLSRLGKHTTGKVCLYIKKLSDVDQGVLEKVIEKSLEVDHSTGQ